MISEQRWRYKGVRLYMILNEYIDQCLPTKQPVEEVIIVVYLTLDF